MAKGPGRTLQGAIATTLSLHRLRKGSTAKIDHRVMTPRTGNGMGAWLSTQGKGSTEAAPKDLWLAHALFPIRGAPDYICKGAW